MQICTQLAKHLREVYLNGTWVSSNMREILRDVTWQEANTKVGSLNTIVALTYHLNYYVDAVIPVFEGGQLDAHDKYSYDHPPVQSPADWQKMLDKTWADAEKLARLVEQLPEEELDSTFVKEKYGSFYRNIQGLIEHSYYHLGQISLIKKLLRDGSLAEG